MCASQILETEKEGGVSQVLRARGKKKLSVMTTIDDRRDMERLPGLHYLIVVL